MYSPQNTPILGKDRIQAGTRAFHCRLTVQTQHNHTQNKGVEIHSMDIKVDAIQTMTNILECMSIPQIQQATAQDDHLQ